MSGPSSSEHSSYEPFSSHTSIAGSAVNLPKDCINLGQGYMNFAPPNWIIQATEQALNTVAPNHYSPPRGRVRLREAIRDFYQPLLGRSLDTESEILVTSGANEGASAHTGTRQYLKILRVGQYSVFTAFLEQGDEVIMFEPFFDQYVPSVIFNGGKAVYVPMHPPAPHIEKPTSDDWTIDPDEVRYVCSSFELLSCDTRSQRASTDRQAITSRTKMIIINTPHNPVGKVFTRVELEAIATIAEEYNLIVMSDEVVSRQLESTQIIASISQS